MKFINNSSRVVKYYDLYFLNRNIYFASYPRYYAKDPSVKFGWSLDKRKKGVVLTIDSKYKSFELGIC